MIVPSGFNFEINDGETVVVTIDDIFVVSSESDNANVIFAVSDVTDGSFILTIDETIVTSFTREQLAAGEVSFKHDGNSVLPSFNIQASVNGSGGNQFASSIVFNSVENDAPTVTQPSITISEGQSKVVSLADLGVNDIDSISNEIIISLSNIQNGIFINSSWRDL